MAKIVFFIDFQEGHYIPTFTVAHALKSCGHDVTYLGIMDCQEQIVEQGFEFRSIGTNLYPRGYIVTLKNIQKANGSLPRMHFLEAIDNELNDFIIEADPDIFMVSTYLSLEALIIKNHFQRKVIIFTPYLVSDSDPQLECWNTIFSISDEDKDPLVLQELSRWGNAINSHDDLYAVVSELNHFPELIACPVEFDLPGAFSRIGNNSKFIGPCVQRRHKASDLLAHIPVHKKIIYAAMGSQTSRFWEKCKTLYHMLVELMREDALQDFHLVLSLGELEIIEGSERLSNVTCLKWAPQLEVLSRAAVMITHGGLGTVKECIFNGVPMIVIPDKYDQPLNAERVDYHNLGRKANLFDLDKKRLLELLLSVTSSALIQESIKSMMAIFHAAEHDAFTIHTIENQLPGKVIPE